MNVTAKSTATLSFSDGSAPVEFPVYGGSIGPDVIDIRKLYGPIIAIHLWPWLYVHCIV